jgi:hypothetical protein
MLWPGDAHVQRRHVALRVQPGRQLALRDRVVQAVGHVFFTAPQQLDGRARHLLGNRHRLAHPVVHRAAAAKTAAEVDLVDLALRGRQACCFGRRGQCGFAVLRGGPHLAPVRRPLRRGVHRLHRGVVLVRVGVHRLDLACCAGQRLLHIAMAIAHGRLLGIQAGLQRGVEAGLLHSGVGAQVPIDGQCGHRLVRAPPGVGHHGHGVVADLHHLLHAGQTGHLGRVKAAHLAAKDGAGADGRVEHAGQLQVGTIDLFAGGLVHRVQARHALAHELPVLGVLELDLCGHWQLASRCGHLAVRGAPARSAMRDHTRSGAALGRWHLPAIGRSLHQHHAGSGAALAHVLLAFADAAAAAGAVVAPDAFTRQVLARRGVLGGDAGPIAFQLFGHHLRQAGQRALPHLAACDADDDFFVRLDDDPSIDFGRHALCGGAGGKAEDKRTCGGARQGGANEIAAIQGGAHQALLATCTMSSPALRISPAACLMAARTRL